MDDQRDYAEEEFNRRDMQREREQEGAVEIAEPLNSFGRAAWLGFYPQQVDVSMWDGPDATVQLDWRLRWCAAAQAAIEAYDRHLVGKADEYADQVAGVPSFADQLTDAMMRDDQIKADARAARKGTP